MAITDMRVIFSSVLVVACVLSACARTPCACIEYVSLTIPGMASASICPAIAVSASASSVPSELPVPEVPVSDCTFAEEVGSASVVPYLYEASDAFMLISPCETYLDSIFLQIPEIDSVAMASCRMTALPLESACAAYPSYHSRPLAEKTIIRSRFDICYPPIWSRMWVIRQAALERETRGENTDALWCLYMRLMSKDLIEEQKQSDDDDAL